MTNNSNTYNKNQLITKNELTTSLTSFKTSNSPNLTGVVCQGVGTGYKVDTKILPLFSIPVLLKEINLQQRNKYNFNLLNPQKKLTYKVISLKEILSIYLKGLNLYNLNLNKYLKKHNKLELITQLKNKDNEYYKLNIRISNYFYNLKRFIPVFKIRSLIYNLGLFIPTRLLKPEPNVIFSYRLRYLYKLFILVPFLKLYSLYSATINGKDKRRRKSKDLYLKILKRKIKMQRRILRKLINVGKNLVKELNYYIYIKKILIKKLEKNQSLEQVKNLILLNSFSSTHPVLDSGLKRIPVILKGRGGSALTTSTGTTESISTVLSEQGKSLDKAKKLKNQTLNRNELLVEINEKKLIINKTFNSIYKNNEIKIEQTIKSILKTNNFDSKTDSIIHSMSKSVATHPCSVGRAPVKLLYTSNPLTESKPIINQYLKAMSIYNMKSKGVFIFYSNVIGFNFNMETSKLVKNVYNLLCASFKSMYCLISKPVFVITPDKIIIQLFYYLLIPNILKLKKMHKYGNRNKLNNQLARIPYGTGLKKNKIKKQYSKFRKIKIKVRIKLRKLSNITLIKVFPLKFKKLCLILSRLFNKPVELDLIRLHYPYNDSNILVNLLGIMINKIKLRIIIRRLFENAIIKNLNNFTLNSKVNIIPAFLSGINIRVAGRLLTHRVVPRQTVKTTRRGACARGKINFSDVARYTNKNKRGAFSITVSSGQNYF